MPLKPKPSKWSEDTIYSSIEDEIKALITPLKKQSKTASWISKAAAYYKAEKKKRPALTYKNAIIEYQLKVAASK